MTNHPRTHLSRTASGAHRTSPRRRLTLLTTMATTGALLAGLLGTSVAPASATTPTTTSMAAVVPQSPAYQGETVDFVAEVSATSGAPSGTVTFSVGTKPAGPHSSAPGTSGLLALCSSTLFGRHSGPAGHSTAYATAACSSSRAPVGAITVVASYAGNATYAASSATSSLVVYTRSTTTTVSVNSPVTGQGTVVTYHATVTGAGPSPTGSVRFSLTGITTSGGLSGETLPETTTQCSGALSNGSASCKAKVPQQNGAPGNSTTPASAGDTVNAPNDVTATYVPTGGAHLSSSGQATLEVVDFNGSNDDFDGGVALQAVSCATATFCVVVDHSGDEITYSDGHWSGPRQVEPGTYGGYGLTAVSCPSTTFCAAVGGNVDGSGSVVMYNGTSWSAPQLIAPSPPSPEGDIGLVAISCASSVFCMAADAYGNAYYYDGSSWSGPTSLNLPGPDDEVTSLSCTKPDYCAAVTYDAYNADVVGSAGGLFLQYRHSGISYLSSVSCATPTDCTAVGLGVDGGAIEQAGHLTNVHEGLSSVSCPTSTFCVAVGSGAGSSADPYELTYAGSSWSPSTDIGAVSPDLVSISCPSNTFCMAVGDQQAITWTGGSARLPSSSGTGGQPGSTSSCGACNHNLIENPGAEAGPGTGSTDQVPVPDWKTTGSFTAVQYAWSGGDQTVSTPGPPDRGKNYFTGGYASAVATGSQTIEIPASALSGGGTTYTLSGWLGGEGGQGDDATLHAAFQTATGTTLATATIGPVTPKERDDNTELLKVSTSGAIPQGTRQVLITLVFQRDFGAYNDGDADNLSLIFS